MQSATYHAHGAYWHYVRISMSSSMGPRRLPSLLLALTQPFWPCSLPSNDKISYLATSQDLQICEFVIFHYDDACRRSASILTVSTAANARTTAALACYS